MQQLPSSFRHFVFALSNLGKKLTDHCIDRRPLLRRDKPRPVQDVIVDGESNVLHERFHSYTGTVYA